MLQALLDVIVSVGYWIVDFVLTLLLGVLQLVGLPTVAESLRNMLTNPTDGVITIDTSILNIVGNILSIVPLPQMMLMYMTAITLGVSVRSIRWVKAFVPTIGD